MWPELSPSIQGSEGFSDFTSAARGVLRLLHNRLGFDLWMVTRTEGDDWIVLHAEDHGYGVKDGTVFRWADSFCFHMVEGRGPRIAPRSDAVAEYAAAPIGRQVKIGAYVGVPLSRADGSLFGTLCAIHPAPQPAAIQAEQPLVELLSGLLSTILAAELRAAEEGRRAERAQAEAMTDALTGLYNRRGWDHLVAAEEERCRRFGHPACVVSIDLNGLKEVNDTQGHAAGDELLRRCGDVLRTVLRQPDIAARLGGDEFAVLCVESDAHNTRSLIERVRTALAERGVAASFGLAGRQPAHGIVQALHQADQAMYAEKRAGRWA
jgi:diguanylate cyclase (GGDEF)-like protein